MALYRLGERTPQLAPTAYVFETAAVIGDVILSDDVSIWPGAVLRGDNDAIHIGAGSNIQDGSVLHTDTGHPLVIEANVTVGHQAMLHGCTIGTGSLIGMQAIILNGARIGRNCLIGAGALVPEGREIPDNSLVVGRPGKVLRQLTDDDLTAIRAGNRHYIDRARLYRDQLERIG